MDNYYEHMVARPLSIQQKLLDVLIVLAAVAIVFVAFLLIPSFALLIAFGAGYGVYWLLRQMNLEFEYIVTNEEMDVDKIISRAKRKRMLTYRFSDIVEMAPCTDDGFRRACEKKDYGFKLDASSRTDIGLAYYAVLNHKDKGRCFLIFEPNEDIKKVMKRANPRAITLA